MKPSHLYIIAVAIMGFGWMTENCSAQTFQYPPYGAQRGRMVSRDGVGHSVRYHWGNGLTPAGAGVITSAVHEFAPAVIAIAGARDFDFSNQTRDFEAEQRSRDLARSNMRDELAEAQERANDLLARTARLLDPTFQYNKSNEAAESEGAAATDDIGSDPWGETKPNPGKSLGTPSSQDNIGPDPWDSVKDNPKKEGAEELPAKKPDALK